MKKEIVNLTITGISWILVTNIEMFSLVISLHKQELINYTLIKGHLVSFFTFHKCISFSFLYINDI